ncbi:unnamed protein product [Linum trigynum]|uniref:Uncharacterized protein n=1 Tax=Linum trigynum TaxID=586398 RepID=A0AAV2CSC2_9ROSI
MTTHTSYKLAYLLEHSHFAFCDDSKRVAEVVLGGRSKKVLARSLIYDSAFLELHLVWVGHEACNFEISN